MFHAGPDSPVDERPCSDHVGGAVGGRQRRVPFNTGLHEVGCDPVGAGWVHATVIVAPAGSPVTVLMVGTAGGV